jgi:hypothetical protein
MAVGMPDKIRCAPAKISFPQFLWITLWEKRANLFLGPVPPGFFQIVEILTSGFFPIFHLLTKPKKNCQNLDNAKKIRYLRTPHCE